jgi:nicotinic acid phosphoribosyltransferase
MRIEGPYLAFARLETSLLGFLSHASGMATAALDCRVAAPDSQVLSFGARHVHPSMTAAVERSALVAGFDGFSHVAAGDLLGREASGTMPHALSICFGRGEQEAAWRAFDEAVGPDVPRVALTDTYSDEVDEALRAADAGADVVLVDNATPADTERAVELLADHETLVEASGGITLATLADYAATGADVVSMGCLTHSAPSLDFSFRVEGD